jgi:hypothetical protein
VIDKEGGRNIIVIQSNKWEKEDDFSAEMHQIKRLLGGRLRSGSFDQILNHDTFEKDGLQSTTEKNRYHTHVSRFVNRLGV